MKEYTHTKMKRYLPLLTLLDLFLLFGKGEFIYADTASVPPEYKACLCSSCEDHIDDNHHTGYSLIKRMEKSSQKGFPLNRIISYRNV